MKIRHCKVCGKTMRCRRQRCSTCQKKWKRANDPEGYKVSRARQRANRLSRGLCMRCNQQPRDSVRYCQSCLDTSNRKQRDQRAAARLEVIGHYGGSCACCGEKHILFLTIDHIDGGGNQHRKSLRLSAGAAFYAWLKRNNFPAGYRVLCWNCNITTGLYGSCPHKGSCL
jgi:hypothetical protein